MRLAVPSMIGALMQSGLPVVEGWWVGTLGAEALASVALVFPLFMLANMLSAGAIGGAVAGATARAVGAEDHARASAVLTAAFWLGIVSGFIWAVLMFAYGRSLFELLGGSGEVLEGAVRYANITFGGIVLILLYNFLVSVLRGAGDMAYPARGIFIVAVVHFACCAVMVPAYGLEGAGASLLIAYVVGCLYVGVRLLSPGTPVRAVLRHPEGLGPMSVLPPVLRAGLLASVQSATTILMAIGLTGVAARMGTEALAGYGIGVRLELLMIPVIFGFGSATIAMSGKAVGAGDRSRAIRVGWTGSGLAMVLVGVIGVTVALFPMLWTSLFTSEPAIVALAACYLLIVGPCYGFFGLGLALYFASQATRTLFWPVFGTLVRLTLLLIGLWLFEDALTDPETLFAVIGGAMVCYGLFVAGALRIGPWRPASSPS